MHVAARGRSVVLAAIVLIMSACSSSPGDESQSRAEAVYGAVVRWFAQQHTDDPDPLPVFIEARGEGASIELDVQAAVVKASHDVATVRFIDSRDEALQTNDDGTVVVADGGVLLRLAPVIEKGNAVTLDVDVHDHDDEFKTLEFDLKLSDDTWTIEKTPVQVPTG